MIWFVAYGAGLLGSHFAMCIGAVPDEQRRVMLPFARYFARYYEGTADGRGGMGMAPLAFLDLGTEDETVARAYLLSDGEFTQWEKAQGPWYDLIVDLGDIEGHPARAFTSSLRLPDSPPSASYLELLERGEAETALVAMATCAVPGGAQPADGAVRAIRGTTSRGEPPVQAMMPFADFLAATAPGRPRDDGRSTPLHAPIGYHPRSLVRDEDDEEGGGFEYEENPAIFGRRCGYGPLRVAWDTNVLSDYARYGSQMWDSREPFDPAKADPPVTEPRYWGELMALAALMRLWTIRDIRLHVFAYQLADAKRRLPPEQAEVRDYQLRQLAAALDCLRHGTGAPDFPEYVPPMIDTLPDSPDRRVLELAVDAGCHVLLTRDRPFTRRAGDAALARGVVLLPPTALLDRLDAAGEPGVAATGRYLVPDNHKFVHVMPATAADYHGDGH